MRLPIVDTSDALYTPERCAKDVKDIADAFPEYTKLFEFGVSNWGAPLYCVTTGNFSARRRLLILGGTHAREYMTSQLVVKLAEQISIDHEREGGIADMEASGALGDVCLFFVPMLNPDGIIICQRGLSAAPALYQPFLRNVPLIGNVAQWKANGAGVDLNRTFPVGWRYTPLASEGYSGEEPLRGAPEARALTSLCEAFRFDLAINYHASGESIYWKQQDFDNSVSLPLAEAIKRLTGYVFEEDDTSYGGFKGWFTHAFNRPAFTIEIGKGPTPLPASQFPVIFAQNRAVPPLCEIWVRYQYDRA